MCGLVSIITKKNNGFSKDQVDAFDNLLFIDALRGMDSTGVIAVDRAGNMDLAKEATPSFYFRQDEEYKKLLHTSFSRGRALVGHNRAATKGQVTDANAHPFVVDDRITLCHNGTLWGDFTKLTKAKVEVDSHAIAHKIHEHDDNVEAALQEVSGAYALIWHDFKHNTLNFVRNNQRPLNWIETEDGWIWASEANMIDWIMSRYNFKALTDVQQLDAGVLVTYDFSKETWKVDHKEIELEAPKPAYTPPVMAPAGNWMGRQPRMHPYANGYSEEGYMYDDEGYELQAPSCELPELPHQVKQTSTNVTRLPAPAPSRLHVATPNQAAASVRVLNHEQKMMAIEGINQQATKYMDETASIPTGSIQRGYCFDFCNVVEGKPDGGWFLYARLDANNDYVIRAHVPASKGEKYLMDLTINMKDCMFEIGSRQWRSYNDAGNGIGYGMFTAKSYSDVVEMESSE